MRKYNLPIFIPHRGCPHDCTFCNQRKITGVDTDITPEYVRTRIAEYLETVSTEESTVEVAFFGGSFTGLEIETQESFLRVASEFGARLDGIRLSTRPDYISKEILELLKKYGVTTVELGVQSSDDDVLRLNSRGHTFCDVVNASKLIKEYGISLGHQMMLGMYGSTPEKDMKTVSDIIALEPSCVRIYPVITLKDTALEDLYQEGKYEPYSTETAAKLAKQAVCAFREKKIEVIRVGLHASEDLEGEGNLVAGPYHPAFGEIVESLIYRDEIECEILLNDAKNCDFQFICKKGDVSKAVGHKKMNLEYFRRKYNITLKVKEEDIMQKIASFTVDHRFIREWIYISRIDGDITTYDVRMRKPNTGDVMSNALMHSFEHLFATFMRNGTLKDDVIYVGPMGCQTGFYLLVRNAKHKAVINEVKRVLGEIAVYNGEMPGSSEIECGNYRNLDVNLAKAEAISYLEKIKDETENDLNYETGEA